MPDYGRKIIYLSDMEYGNKTGSAGFVKAQSGDGRLILDMHVSGTTGMPDQYYPVLAEYSAGAIYPLGRIFLRAGKGEWKESFDAENMGENGVSFSGLRKLYVELSEKRKIQGSFAGFPDTERKDTGPESAVKGKALREDTAEGNAVKEDKADRNRTEKNAAKEWRKESKMEAPPQEERKNPPELKAGSMEDRPGPEKADGPEADRIILNDKWQQLKRLYPVMHPYEDDREYISIQPKDFVIMTGDCQHLANNSFLLHGFYNYRYLILGKEKGQEGESFYLGVPGVYYEREKMVALMFGFEAFECPGGRSEPGIFGYYLRRVCI